MLFVNCRTSIVYILRLLNFIIFKGEDIFDAAVREVKEETGVSENCMNLIFNSFLVITNISCLSLVNTSLLV